MLFNKESTPRKRQSGGTLVEVMVAIMLAAILGVVLTSSLIHSARSYASMVNYIDLDQKSQNALDTLVRDIRDGTQIVGFDTDGTDSFLEMEMIVGDNVFYSYNQAEGTLTRFVGSDPDGKILLTECDNLTFGLFTRVPMAGPPGTFAPATDFGQTKVITVDWTCSRQILGRTWNTESVQTAKIVMRNQHL